LEGGFSFMGLPKIKNPFKGRQPGAPGIFNPVVTPVPPPTGPPQSGAQGPNTQPLQASASPAIGGTQALDANLHLVNYTPDQLMQQTQSRLSRVQFGWTGFTKWMEMYGEWWSVLGPVILLLGTIGEVFMVLWTRQKQQEIIAGMSIVGVAFALEGTFLAVSYKASAIRNRAERKTNGPDPLDKKKLRRQLWFWLVLAFGVAATQVMFVLTSTKTDGSNGIPIESLWVFAIVRAVLTLAGDAYTAFAHEEKPTTGEQATSQLQEEGKISALLLKQTGENISLVNEQTISLHRRQMQAEVELDSARTESEIKKMENRNRIATLKAQSEQAEMFTRLGTGIIRAMFDPDVPDDTRQKILSSVSVFTEMAKQLPASKTTITEEDE
jgi:hypothetical protein